MYTLIDALTTTTTLLLRLHFIIQFNNQSQLPFPATRVEDAYAHTKGWRNNKSQDYRWFTFFGMELGKSSPLTRLLVFHTFSLFVEHYDICIASCIGGWAWVWWHFLGCFYHEQYFHFWRTRHELFRRTTHSHTHGDEEQQTRMVALFLPRIVFLLHWEL